MSRFSLTIPLLQTTQLTSKKAALFAIIDSARSRIVLLILIVLFGMMYLWLVNSSAQAGFHLTDLEQQISQLESEYKKAEVDEAQLQSLEHIQQMSEQQQLVAADHVEYITRGATVASTK